MARCEGVLGGREAGVGRILTGVGVVVLVVGDQESIALGGSGLLGEVLVFDLGELDHLGGDGWGKEMRLMGEGG